jgi:uncharacterized glyoxalase superfamily protein PhnB
METVMAKSLTPRKKKTVRATRRVTGMNAMPTDSWASAKFYVHYEVETREWGNAVKSYIKKYLDKRAQVAVDSLPDWKVSSFSHWATTAHLLEIKPEIVPEVYKTGLVKFVSGLVEEGKQLVATKKSVEQSKKSVHVPSIQERLMEAAEEKLEEIETWHDDFLRDPKKNTLSDKNPSESFRKNEINLGHTRWITKWYENSMSEMEELLSLPKTSEQTEMQKQLAEGYSYLTKAQQKELLEFYKRIFQAVEILRAEKKQVRPVRKVKQKSAAELVKKLKFKPSDVDAGIASVNPTEVIGATAIVVFNCKNRKLGVYYAEDGCTIQVKGTSLQFFDENRSTQKTVRKPQEILPQWKKVTKHKLSTQFDYIKTTETKLNGRFNEDTVILKAFK